MVISLLSCLVYYWLMLFFLLCSFQFDKKKKDYRRLYLENAKIWNFVKNSFHVETFSCYIYLTGLAVNCCSFFLIHSLVNSLLLWIIIFSALQSYLVGYLHHFLYVHIWISICIIYKFNILTLTHNMKTFSYFFQFSRQLCMSNRLWEISKFICQIDCLVKFSS